MAEHLKSRELNDKARLFDNEELMVVSKGGGGSTSRNNALFGLESATALAAPSPCYRTDGGWCRVFDSAAAGSCGAIPAEGTGLPGTPCTSGLLGWMGAKGLFPRVDPREVDPLAHVPGFGWSQTRGDFVPFENHARAFGLVPYDWPQTEYMRRFFAWQQAHFWPARLVGGSVLQTAAGLPAATLAELLARIGVHTRASLVAGRFPTGSAGTLRLFAAPGTVRRPVHAMDARRSTLGAEEMIWVRPDARSPGPMWTVDCSRRPVTH